MQKKRPLNLKRERDKQLNTSTGRVRLKQRTVAFGRVSRSLGCLCLESRGGGGWKGTLNVYGEVIAKRCINLTQIKTHISKKSMRKTARSHTLSNCWKPMTENLKISQKKKAQYYRERITHFSLEATRASRWRGNVFKALKEKKSA